MNIKIGGNTYPLIAAYTTGTGAEWGFRDAYYISLMMDFALAHELFTDGAAWSLTVDSTPDTEIDHSDYCVAGRITDYRNGRIDVLMGKKTEAELKDDESARILPIIQRVLPELSDEEALSMTAYFPVWEVGKAYSVDEKVRYSDVLYRCLVEHNAESSWTPVDAPSLWARVLIVQPDEIPEWVQPDATNAYMIGDKVTLDGVVYISTIDNNVWNPEEYPQGWETV